MSTVDSDALVAELRKAIAATRTGLLGVAGAREAHSQPMTAHFDDPSGPFWFYTHRDSKIVEAVSQDDSGVFHYVSGDHGLYACIHGAIAVETDRATIERFWSSEVAEWFDGQDDPAIALLKFDAADAQIWISADGAAAKRLHIGKATGSAIDVRAKARL